MPKFSFLLLLLILTSCVERRIRIDSDPPNAVVIVDGKELKETTPVEIPFDFYGTREITVAKKNFYISTYHETVSPPIYQYFPIDFFVENLYPGTIYDVHSFTYTLKPHIPLNNAQKDSLLKRAENLRKESK